MDPLAERGFGRDLETALIYDRGRPDYAPELAPWLADELRLDGSSRLLDLAAGTGQLARLFAPLVGTVVAVEPSPAMRDVLRERVPEVEVLDGLAEHIPLEDASVDAVVVGNAFHWFDGDAALRELARVIKPEGALAVIFNLGLESEPPAPELEALVNDHRSRAKVSERPDWRAAFDRSDCFEPLRSRELLHSREQDRDTFAAYLSSLAFIAAMPDRDTVAGQIRALTPDRSVLTMRTECFWTRRRP